MALLVGVLVDVWDGVEVAVGEGPAVIVEVKVGVGICVTVAVGLGTMVKVGVRLGVLKYIPPSLESITSFWQPLVENVI